MEKVEIKKIETEEIKHKFYCDMCDSFLGESTEDDDGYYTVYGNAKHRIFARGNNYTLKMNLCNACYQKKMNEVIEALEKVGYVKD